MRFFPEREKQNERIFGNVEPCLSEDATDLGDLEAFGGLVGTCGLDVIDRLGNFVKIFTHVDLCSGVTTSGS
jgi:hypothetical protein